jgi:hypothetical protein
MAACPIVILKVAAQNVIVSLGSKYLAALQR